MEFQAIKEDDLFLITNPHGDVPDPADDGSGYGLYTRDTRVLSRWRMEISDLDLELLQTDNSANFESTYLYTNRERRALDGGDVGRETLMFVRRQVVTGSHFYEQVTVRNYSSRDISFRVRYHTGVDFADMFAVRGYAQNWRGNCAVHLLSTDHGGRYTYKSADGIPYQTEIAGFVWRHSVPVNPLADETQLEIFSEQREAAVASEASPWADAAVVMGTPGSMSDDGRLEWNMEVAAKAGVTWVLRVTSTLREGAGEFLSFDFGNVLECLHQERLRLQQSYSSWVASALAVEGDGCFHEWHERGLRDVRMLLTDLGEGPLPVAGVPWFAVPFGRDSLIAAMQLLSAHPEVAAGTLRTLASRQGKSVNPSRDEQPGKIMHEIRFGELTRTGKVPFGPYYGTIDATPLFLNLVADYYRWTGDEDLLHEIMPHVYAAFDWIEQYGDRDGDGFVEYYQESGGGLANQGWKDSGDCMVHEDGRSAEGSIALCEVQGYVYRAYRQWEELFNSFGEGDRSRRCGLFAESLQRRFMNHFWLPDVGIVAMALDGNKQPLGVASSNMGQVLWSEILPEEVAQLVIRRLMQPDLFSGYGIRTLSSAEVAYNPLSYHNGSVWPHDNSLIVLGLSALGAKAEASKLAGALAIAASYFPHRRLPELFTGYPMDRVRRPIPYPVSCSPQAWAAATPVMVFQALLGLQPNVPKGSVSFDPILPDGTDWLKIKHLRIGAGELDLELRREASGHVALEVLRNTTGLAVARPALCRDGCITG